MATEYGERLRAARKYAGLTQIKLHKKTGIPQSTISTAERIGHGSSDTTTFAAACGVDPHWLATGQGEMVNNSHTANEPLATYQISQVGKPFPKQSNTGAILSTAQASDLLGALAEHLKAVPHESREAVYEALRNCVLFPDQERFVLLAAQAIGNAQSANLHLSVETRDFAKTKESSNASKPFARDGAV